MNGTSKKAARRTVGQSEEYLSEQDRGRQACHDLVEGSKAATRKARRKRQRNVESRHFSVGVKSRLISEDFPQTQICKEIINEEDIEPYPLLELS